MWISLAHPYHLPSWVSNHQDVMSQNVKLPCWSHWQAFSKNRECICVLQFPVTANPFPEALRILINQQQICSWILWSLGDLMETSANLHSLQPFCCVGRRESEVIKCWRNLYGKCLNLRLFPACTEVKGVRIWEGGRAGNGVAAMGRPAAGGNRPVQVRQIKNITRRISKQKNLGISVSV